MTGIDASKRPVDPAARLVAEKRLDVAVRVGPGPLQLLSTTTSTSVGPERPFRLLSVPFAMVSEVPRLVRELG